MTLADQDAAAKERFRARDLVQKASQLGNTENLRQLLQDLSANGEVRFSDNPAVEQVMNAGEAAFARRDFDEALTIYAKTLGLEPTNYSAMLFTANTYDRKKTSRAPSLPLLCRRAGHARGHGQGTQHAHSSRRGRTV